MIILRALKRRRPLSLSNIQRLESSTHQFNLGLKLLRWHTIAYSYSEAITFVIQGYSSQVSIVLAYLYSLYMEQSWNPSTWWEPTWLEIFWCILTLGKWKITPVYHAMKFELIWEIFGIVKIFLKSDFCHERFWLNVAHRKLHFDFRVLLDMNHGCDNLLSTFPLLS